MKDFLPIRSDLILNVPYNLLGKLKPKELYLFLYLSPYLNDHKFERISIQTLSNSVEFCIPVVKKTLVSLFDKGLLVLKRRGSNRKLWYIKKVDP